MKKVLDTILKKIVQECIEKGVFKDSPLSNFVIEVPNNPDHGHYATNLPMTYASLQKRPPLEIARIIVDCLLADEGPFESVEVAGPGFINFKIRREEWHKTLGTIVALGNDYGRSSQGKGEKILVEFVSANPTGPIHLGHGRGAAVGDTICRVLSFCGYDVVREFYINDAGQQIRLLGESILSRWRQLSDPDYPFSEKGYHGEYIMELAREISDEIDLSGLDDESAIEQCIERGKEKMLLEIKKDLADFRIHFDVWSRESDIYATGLHEESMERLKERGDLYEKDGALWIKTSAFGDDKDRVIRKSDGQFTYFASDISYHIDKWRRGFTKAVNIWGADHHGYVQRVKSALKASGIDEDWLSVQLIQLVKLWKGGQEIRMSKRTGQYVTLRELMDEVGVDAVRFVFLTKNHDSTLDFDMDLVKKQNSDNPVYYVQYAHARISSVFRKALSEGITLLDETGPVLDRLVLPDELALIRLMAEFPTLLEEMCRSFEAHRLTYYLAELASGFHRYFNLGNKIPEDRIVTSDKTLSRARLALAEAIRIVLHNGLRLLGIHAPERM